MLTAPDASPSARVGAVVVARGRGAVVSPAPVRAALGYCRVSTEGQADAGVSLEMQRAKIEAYCALHDLPLAGVLVDAGESGKTMDRPAMGEALARVRAGEVSHLIVYKLDRLTRRTRDLLAVVEDDLRPRGVALVSLSEAIDTGSPAGVMVLTMLGALAQMERELIAERTRAALAHKRDKGERLGASPLGYVTPEPGAALQADAAELAPVRVILRERAAGRTYRAIAHQLRTAGLPTKRGGAWDPATVRKVWERRARYAALMGEGIPNRAPV